MTKWLLITIILLLLVIIGFGGRALFLQKSPGGQAVTSAIPTTAPVITPVVSPTAQGPVIPAGWQTYTNSQYGFTVSYPSSYKALDDKDNLYGWPKAVVLFYGGGQSYDIAVEVWATAAEYQQKYPGKDLTVYQVDGKFLTLADQNDTAENKAIIATFQLTK